MAKVIVYEDSIRDLISRYSHLVDPEEEQAMLHEVHIRFSGNDLDGVLGIYGRRRLIKVGFDEDKIKGGSGITLEEPDQADIYFLDGLRGWCFDVLPKLPRDRAFVNSDCKYVNERAIRDGFNVIDWRLENVEKIIARVTR